MCAQTNIYVHWLYTKDSVITDGNGMRHRSLCHIILFRYGKKAYVTKVLLLSCNFPIPDIFYFGPFIYFFLFLSRSKQ